MKDKVSIDEFVLPLTKDLLKYHTRWNERSLKPYTDELFDLWAENGVDGLLDTQLQGPTLTRFGIVPDDRRSADRIISLLRYIVRTDTSISMCHGRQTRCIWAIY